MCYILSPPLLLLQLAKIFMLGWKMYKKYFLLKLEAKDVTNFGSNLEYNRPFVHSMYQISIYYLPSSPFLLLHLIQNLQVGVKDVQKRLFF